MKNLITCIALFATIPSFAAEKMLHVPSDSKATYIVLDKSGKGNLRTIVTKRMGLSGDSFSKRLYNCKNQTVKYIGTGDTLAEMKASKPKDKMSEIVPGAIADYVGIEACK